MTHAKEQTVNVKIGPVAHGVADKRPELLRRITDDVVAYNLELQRLNPHFTMEFPRVRKAKKNVRAREESEE